MPLAFVGVLHLASYEERNLRGRVETSADGKTYLVVADRNGCKDVLVDGRPWRLATTKSGEVSPGEHSIRCNGEIRFHVEKGTTLFFDYWGP